MKDKGKNSFQEKSNEEIFSGAIGAPALEMLRVHEFAARMGLSRSLVYRWLSDGTLVSGRHYLRIGRAICFPWSERFVLRLMKDLSDEPESSSAEVEKSERPKRARTTGKPGINLDY